jgi:dTDP-4-dehydrorhamnose 3,5-epimerase
VKIQPWTLQDVLVVESEPFLDHRGFFVRTMSAATLADAGLDIGQFVEESQSRSGKGVLRGLHGRAALSEGKLVRCASGSVFEVILDLRPWSTTFLRWDTLVLDDVEHRQVWVPPGFVHGFQALTPQADICYRMDAVHDPSLDIGLAWNDPDLGIEWPLPDPVLSARDQAAPSLAEIRPHLESWFGSSSPT